MPAGTQQQPMNYRERALSDPSVPQALKDLMTRIIPEKRFEDLRELVEHGAIDPLAVPEKFPLMSAVSQVMAAEKPKEWLAVLFSHAPETLAQAVMPKGYYDTNIDNYYDDNSYRSKIETPSLLAQLLQSGDTPLMDIMKLVPQPDTVQKMLESKAVPRNNSDNVQEPLFHHLWSSSEMKVATLDKLEQLTGGTDFLMIKNSRGETLFHRIAALAGWKEEEEKLDLASWMLQRNPRLVNEPDRFGWTPLDRLISRAQGADSSMGRLLLVSGARLEKQIAPKFNLATELDERSGKRLDKPAMPPVRKLPGLTNG